MLYTKIVLNVRNNLCTQRVLPRFELGTFMYRTCNSMNNPLSYCRLVDSKIRAPDKNLPVHTSLKINVWMKERKVVMRNNKVIYRSAVMLTAYATLTVGLFSQIVFIFLRRSERNWGQNFHCAFVV